MEIGKGWTKTKEQTKETYISCVFDDTFVELCPNLKNCGLILRHISDRKTEKSPHWTVRLFAKKEQETTKEETNNQVEVVEFGETEIIPF